MSRLSKQRRKEMKKAYHVSERSEARKQMCLAESGLRELLDFLDAVLSDTGCDHSLTHTQRWAKTKKIDFDRLRASLENFGGFCDCEVIYNVDPDEIFKV